MQSYLSGRNDAKRTGATPPPAPQMTALARVTQSQRQEHAQHGQPEVECVKQGNRVTRIIVTCGCGERIEIDCVYPDGV